MADLGTVNLFVPPPTPGVTPVVPNAAFAGPTQLLVSPVAAPTSGQVWPPGEILNPLPPDTFSMNLIGGTTVTVTHNMGTLDVVVAVYRVSDGVEVDVPFSRTSINSITLNSVIDLSGHRVVILASGASVTGLMAVTDQVITDASVPLGPSSTNEPTSTTPMPVTDTPTVVLT